MRNFFIQLTKRSVPSDIDSEYHVILNSFSQFYMHLVPKLQEMFRLRLYQFLNVVAFRGAKEVRIVTREMRVVIGCAFIEITFGLDTYLPSRFKKIVVMPRRYMYPGYGEPFLGHMDFENNLLYFSWPDVVEGYMIHDDAVNVALHEMAHVVEAENNMYNIMQEFFHDIRWEQWAALAFQKMYVIRGGQNGFLKDYGAHNMKEMFAVCIESFFEQSETFKEHLPQIYRALVLLLRQDPTIKENPLNIYHYVEP